MRSHRAIWPHQGLVANTDAANDYLQAHDHALNYAKLNRHLIGHRMMEQIHTHQGTVITDVNHNLVEPCELYNQQGMVTSQRGDARPSRYCGVIPGSRAVITVISLNLLSLN